MKEYLKIIKKVPSENLGRLFTEDTLKNFQR